MSGRSLTYCELLFTHCDLNGIFLIPHLLNSRFFNSRNMFAFKSMEECFTEFNPLPVLYQDLTLNLCNYFAIYFYHSFAGT